MANPSVFPGDVRASGNIIGQGLFIEDPTITDAMISPVAAIDADKQEHYYEKQYSQLATANAATDRQVLHVVRGSSGSVVELAIGARTAGTGTSTVTVDLKKNGTTILTGSASLTSATAAFALLLASIATATLATGDVLELHITAVSAGSGALPIGLFAQLRVREFA